MSTAVHPSYVMRPHRAPGTEVHPPSGPVPAQSRSGSSQVSGGSQWIVQRGPRYVRVGAGVARLVQQLDGEKDHAELATTMGWTTQQVERAVLQLDGLGLIDTGEMEAPTAAARWTFVPPLTVQFTLLRPGSTMNRLRGLFALAAAPSALAAAVVVGVAGLFALVTQTTAIQQALGEPLPGPTYVAVLLGLVAGTSVHELAHAGALIRHGGQPSRIGIMIFYLMPAFFCDVSDSWRLPRRSQRVAVALAGPAVQTFLAGLAALVAMSMPDSQARNAVVCFAVGGYVTGVLNLLPFVKLDGYIALMSLVDQPYLRDRAMADARRSVARVLFGGRYRRDVPGRWVTAYGLACLAFPMYLLVTAGTVWMGVLQRAGLGGLLVLGAALAYAGYLGGRGVKRLAAEVARAGASRNRVLGVCLALAAGALALVQLPVPYQMDAAFVSRGESRVDLVLLDGADTAGLRPGQRVELRRNGALLHGEIGSAVIASGSSRRATAPASAFFPLKVAGDPALGVTSYPLTLTTPPSLPTGTARVHIADLPLWKVAHRTWLRPFS